MTTLTKEKNNKLTMKQAWQLADLIKQYLSKPSEEPSHWVYETGWDDRRIFTTFTAQSPENSNVEITHVARCRLKCFGSIEPQSPNLSGQVGKVVVEGLKNRITDLEKRCASFEVACRKYDELAILHAKLCQSLSVNKVIGVTHLAGPAGQSPAARLVAEPARK